MDEPVERFQNEYENLSWKLNITQQYTPYESGPLCDEKVSFNFYWIFMLHSLFASGR